MAIEFLNKFTASVSKTAKQVSDGAKELADKNRIRKDIAATENEIRNRYRDIGEKYFNDNKDNPSPEYSEMFAAIIDLQYNLAAKQHELEAVSGMVACPNCGRGMAIDAKFCANCGASAPAPVVLEPVAPAAVCPNCGQTLAPDAMFCAACGNAVTPPAPAVDAPAADPVAPAQNVCPNCGEILPADALFCAVCGTKAPGLD